MIKIFLLMLLCHIIDDFVLQPVCLSKLKQKSWWAQNAPEFMYEKDYQAALVMHGLSWSIMIILPFIFMCNEVNEYALAFFVMLNAAIHTIVDDLKANDKKINLQTDQMIHLAQIVITFIILQIV